MTASSRVIIERQSFERLLSSSMEDDSESSTKASWAIQYKQARLTKYKHQLIVGICLLILNTIFCICYINWVQSRALQYCVVPQTPAGNVIGVKGKQFDIQEVYFKNGTLNKVKSQFNGPPTPELTMGWKTLVQHQNIAVQKDQLGIFANDENTESLVSLSDGSGYLATLAVYHGLHCLKRFHHYIYRDHYYPNISEADDQTLLFHTEHCLDWLRQYVKCNADTALVPFYWGTNQKSPLYVDIGEHKCANWKSLESWMSKHSFDAFKPGLLVHPVYGDPYGPNFEDKIGISVEEHILHIDHDSP